MAAKPMTVVRRRALEALYVGRSESRYMPGQVVAWKVFRRAKNHAAVVSAALLADGLQPEALTWAQAMLEMDRTVSRSLDLELKWQAKETQEKK